VLNSFCSTNLRVSKDYTVRRKGTHFCSTVTFPITVVPLWVSRVDEFCDGKGSVESAKSETVLMLVLSETVKIQFFIQVNVKLSCTVTWSGDCWRDC
jgi:hypothetical protein